MGKLQAERKKNHEVTVKFNLLQGCKNYKERKYGMDMRLRKNNNNPVQNYQSINNQVKLLFTLNYYIFNFSSNILN